MDCNCCQNCFQEIKKFVVQKVICELEKDRKIIMQKTVEIDADIATTIAKVKKKGDELLLCNTMASLKEAKQEDQEKMFNNCIKKAKKVAKECL
jgi:hypothetical protein